jgi:hypothetical protein
MRSSTERRFCSRAIVPAVSCIAVTAARSRWFAQIASEKPASRNTSVGVE